ncbi:MAG: RNA methyltransferase PUA domain-containing protein, partial [Bacteroidota bacterium]
MQLFFHSNLQDSIIELPEDESKHCIRVLRKQLGDILTLIDEYLGKVPKDYRKVPYDKKTLFGERSNEIIEFNKVAKLELDEL